MNKIKFKEGDEVVVIKRGRSTLSKINLGLRFTVYKAGDLPQGAYVTSSKDCLGYWEDEVEFNELAESPLWRALK